MKAATDKAPAGRVRPATAAAQADRIYMASIYRLTATNFELAAKTLSASLELDAQGLPVRLTALPFYVVASHAAELYLKSALLKRGLTEEELKRRSFRHDLHALMVALLDMGVEVSPATIGLIHQLSDQHATHALRYTALVDNGQPIYRPPPRLVLDMLQELLLLTRTSRHGPRPPPA